MGFFLRCLLRAFSLVSFDLRLDRGEGFLVVFFFCEWGGVELTHRARGPAKETRQEEETDRGALLRGPLGSACSLDPL